MNTLLAQGHGQILRYNSQFLQLLLTLGHRADFFCSFLQLFFSKKNKWEPNQQALSPLWPPFSSLFFICNNWPLLLLCTWAHIWKEELLLRLKPVCVCALKGTPLNSWPKKKTCYSTKKCKAHDSICQCCKMKETYTNEPCPIILGNLSTPHKVWKTVNHTCIQSR